MVRALYRLAVIAVGFVTVLGLLTPIDPLPELINQFRPQLLLMAVLVAALGFLLPTRTWHRAALAIAAVNVALFAVPLFMTADRVSSAPAGESVTLVTFNLGYSREHAAIQAFLQEQDPAVLVLQELKTHHAEELLPALKQMFPHQVICELCGMAVLTKTPLTSVSESPSGRWVSGLWSSPGGRVQRIVGVHFSWPVYALGQKEDEVELSSVVQAWPEPKIVAGDFNLTPWTWKLNKITWTTGLRRHGTFAASWPVYRRVAEKHDFARLPIPSVVLIDNVLTSPEISNESFMTGPDLGSDHRAVVVRLRLP